MEGWTRKCVVVDNVSDEWLHQFQPLEHVFDNAFLNMMHPIEMDKFFGVVLNLPDNKAAGLSALIETAHKILSKIFSDRIFVVCSKYDVFYGDNFSVLKSTMTQSPIFAIGSVIEDALKKNCELWLVLQDMKKAYDSIVKRQEAICGYRMNSHYVAKTGCIDLQDGLIFFLAAGVLYGLVLVRQLHNTFSMLPSLKLKLGLPLDFPNDVLHHSLFYGLKTFEQVQAEDKIAAVICFTNSVKILGQLFTHRSHDLQVLSWCPVHLLCSSLYISVNLLNNFLADVVWVFLGSGLSLGNLMYNVFCFQHGTSLSGIFDVAAAGNILESHEFRSVHDQLSGISVFGFSVYMNDFLCSLKSVDIKAGAAAFFEDINLGLGMEITGIMSSTLVELQAIVLALKCMLSSSSVCLFSDSQAVLNRNLNIGWYKIKGHLGVLGNDQADLLADVSSHSNQFFSSQLKKCFVLANDSIVFGNSRHFKLRSGAKIVNSCLLTDINWFKSSLVWHLDSYMAAGFTSCHFANYYSYFMKALHYRLLVAVCKCLFDKCYPSVVCLYCGNIEVLDYVFSCAFDVAAWIIFGLPHASSCVSQMLSTCLVDLGLETTSCFDNSKIAFDKVVGFVCNLCLSFKNDIWLVHFKHCAFIEKHDLILRNSLIPVSVSGGMSTLSVQVIRLLGIDDTFGVNFGLRSSYMKATASSTTSKKKALKNAFHGPTGGSFFQKKKVVLDNVKHSGDERDISLNISRSSDSVYSDVESLSGEDKNVSMSSINRSLLGSAAITPKVKQINTSAVFGSPLGSPNFHMDDNKVVLPSYLPIFFDKKCIDPKIIKTSVKVSIKKSFTLDINFSAVEEKSIEMAALLAREKRINVNSNLKKQGIRSDWAVIIKKIPMNTLKNMIVATVSEFGEIKLIKIQLIGIWQKAVVEFAELNQANLLASKWSFLIGKNSMCVAKAVGDCKTWASREKTGGKTCIINRSIETGNRICCAVVGFTFDNDLESVFYTEPIFNRVKLSWARMNLVCCKKYGHFRYLALEYDTPDAIMWLLSKRSYKKGALEEFHFWLAKLYEKKCVLISCPAAFGGKSWAQVVLLSNFFGSAHFGFGPSFSSHGLLGLGGIFLSASTVSSGLSNCLAVLEKSLELLADQVPDIIKKLSFVELVPLASKSSISPLVVLAPLDSVVDSDMALDNTLASPVFPPLVVANTVADLSLSSSKVLTTKMGGLESKLVALEVSIDSYYLSMSNLVWKFAMCNIKDLNNLAKQDNAIRWHKDSCNSVSVFTETKLKVFSFGMNSGHCGSRVVIVLNDNLVCHMCKISEVPEHLISVHFFFASKAFVTILGLYAGASAGVRFKQAFAVNVLIASAISSSSYVLFSGDFNEDGAGHSASFKKYSDLGLHNVLSVSSVSKSSMWYNFREVKKTIDFIFVSNYLLSAVFNGCIGRISDHFGTNHLAVSILVELNGLLDKQLNILCKLANTDHWKFNFKDSNAAK
ncbi:hypothetical protein G9A89_019925 [Geosiphon pyriformis]|nr:hypothetical protein G9A89_019925 [Geosiphon pyriformis]